MASAVRPRCEPPRRARSAKRPQLNPGGASRGIRRPMSFRRPEANRRFEPRRTDGIRSAAFEPTAETTEDRRRRPEVNPGGASSKQAAPHWFSTVGGSSMGRFLGRFYGHLWPSDGGVCHREDVNWGAVVNAPSTSRAGLFPHQLRDRLRSHIRPHTRRID